MRSALQVLRSLSRDTAALAATGVIALAISTASILLSNVYPRFADVVPGDRPDRLIRAFAVVDGNGEGQPLSWNEFRRLQTHTRHLTAFASFSFVRRLTVRAGSHLFTDVPGVWVSPEIWDVLRVPGVRHPLTDREAVVSAAFARRLFRPMSAIVGEAIDVNGSTYRVAAVLPSGTTWVSGGAPPPVIVPISEDVVVGERINSTSMGVIGRLASGLSLAEVRAQASAVEDALFIDAERRRRLRLIPAGEALTDTAGATARGRRNSLLFALSACTLLIGAMNTTCLLLARSERNRRNDLIQLALGAPPARIALQHASAGAMIGVTGWALGTLGASTLMRVMSNRQESVRFLPTEEPSGMLLVWLPGLALLTVAVGAATWSSLHVRGHGTVLRPDNPVLKRRPGSLTTFVGATTVQVALSMSLLMAFTLIYRSLANEMQLELGYEPERRIELKLRFAGPMSQVNVLRERARSLPGVIDVALADAVPLQDEQQLRVFRIPRSSRSQPSALNRVSANYFRLLEIETKAGRIFTEAEVSSAQSVAVVNEAFARAQWADRSPVGEIVHILGADSARAIEIVGVVANTRTFSRREAWYPTVFTPLAVDAGPSISMVVHTSGAHTVSAAHLYATAAEVLVSSQDGRPVLASLSTLTDKLGDDIVRRQWIASAIGWVAMEAVLLTLLGVAGLALYAIRIRRRETAIRRALGASSTGALFWTLREMVLAAVAGIACGWGLGYAGSRLVGGYLFGVSPADLSLYLSISILLVAALALAATPALALGRRDPISDLLKSTS